MNYEFTSIYLDSVTTIKIVLQNFANMTSYITMYEERDKHMNVQKGGPNF